jgi:hypothetical protein
MSATNPATTAASPASALEPVGIEPGPHKLDRLPLEVSYMDVLVGLVTSCASLAVLGYGLSANSIFAVFVALHLGTLAVPAAVLIMRRRRGGDRTVPVLLLIATLAAGPVGALGCTAMALALRLRLPSQARLDDWYDYIAGIVARSHVARIYDELVSGRLPTDPTAQVPRFRPLLHRASVDEQQRILGVIGRRYHADFRPALRNALRNKNGFIRAQAAAVASRLSIEEKRRLWSGGADVEEMPGKPAALDAEPRRP